MDELLAEAGLGLRQIEGIAFGAGPGGFTGLRLACGVAQGLGFGLDLPVLAVGSLEAMALAAGRPQVYVCQDARMNEVYVAAYRSRAASPSRFLRPRSRRRRMRRCRRARAGSAAATASSPTRPCSGNRWGDALPEIRPKIFPTASSIARLAAPRFARGEGMDAAAAAPAYVRDKVALTTVERLAQGGLR